MAAHLSQIRIDFSLNNDWNSDSSRNNKWDEKDERKVPEEEKKAPDTHSTSITAQSSAAMSTSSVSSIFRESVHLSVDKCKSIMRRIIRIFVPKKINKAEFKRNLKVYLATQSEVWREPKFSKKQSNFLYVYEQAALIDETVIQTFIRSAYSAHIKEWEPWDKTVKYQQKRVWNMVGEIDEDSDTPAIKAELERMDLNQPDLLFDRIVADDRIKYIILAELHHQKASKTWLQRYKKKLAGEYDIIGSEFYPCVAQARLDAYHFRLVSQADISTKMVPNYYTERCARHSVLRELDEEGLRIVAIEDSYSINLPAVAHDRLSAMDDAAARIVQHELIERAMKKIPLSRNSRGKRKAIVWVGVAHAEGIARYLGRSSCMIIGARDTTNPSIRCELNSHFYRKSDVTKAHPVDKYLMDVIFDIPERIDPSPKTT